MRKIVWLLFLVPCLLPAQKTSRQAFPLHPVDSRISLSDFHKVFIGSAELNAVESYLKLHIRNLSFPNSSVLFLSKIESPAGYHLLFQQVYNNIPVYRAQIKVNMDKHGYITSLFDNTYALTEGMPSGFPATQTINNAINKLASQKETDLKHAEENYFFDGTRFIPVARIEITRKNMEHFETMIDANGAIIYHRDLNNYYHKKMLPDTVVKASVFLPDPLTTAGVTYGAPYLDMSDSDLTVLNVQRKIVDITVNFSNDSFRLANSYATVMELSDPVTKPTICKSDTSFHFTRHQFGFEDVNSFYHISTFQKRIRTLGFNNLVNYQIQIDAHALNGQDNSMFSNSYVPGRLLFGQGGVDDAEDADVCIHEFGHAISFSAAPNTNNGSQRTALDEGNGDYFASSYSRILNSYKWDWVFNWDGHNEFWGGRYTVSNKHYPEDLLNDLYQDAEMWSATMMQIWADIGRDTTDQIVIQSIYGYATNMTMKDAAHLLIQADSSLHGGRNYNAICSRLFARGLTQVCIMGIQEQNYSPSKSIQLLNSAAFATGGEAVLKFAYPATATIRLTNVEGKIIFNHDISNATQEPIRYENLAEGIYLLQVQTPSEVKSFKLIRY